MNKEIRMKVKINNKEISLDIQGEKSYGSNEILLKSDEDLTRLTPWTHLGYSVEPFLDKNSFKLLISGLRSFFNKQIESVLGAIPKDFKAEDYHRLNGLNQSLHLEIMKRCTQLPYSDFPISVHLILARIEQTLKIPLSITNPHNGWERFHIRTVRPKSDDFNPLHRDAWLDRLRNGINLYIPLAGSTDQSSLALIPGSHLWEESMIERTLSGAIMNNSQYKVPALTNVKKEFEFIRPNPSSNEVLIFSPYLLHGASANFNKNETRLSLEMRLWKK